MTKPKLYPPSHTKLPRAVAAWRWGFDDVPFDVVNWVKPVPAFDATWTVISPNSGHAVVFGMGWWIIQTEVGCLYAVTDEHFRAKYEALRHAA